jgi:hypothetical protein
MARKWLMLIADMLDLALINYTHKGKEIVKRSVPSELIGLIKENETGQNH